MGVQDKTYTLRGCKAVVDVEGVKTNVNIVVEKGLIKSVGKEVEGDELECSDYVVIPGLVNAHTHSAMIALRGFSDDKELKDWLNDVWEFERSFPRELMRVSTEVAVIEMLESGTTAFVDMYFNPEDVKEMSEKYGIRAQAGYVFLDSMMDPSEVERKQKSLRRGELFSPIVNVHSPYSVSQETLKLAFELSEELGQRVHMHVSETRSEVFLVKAKTGKFPVEYLAENGLPKGAQLVHLGWITSWELDLLKNVSAFPTYCPTSSMKLATAGAFPLYEAMKRGLSATLGTDGPASNNSLDMFREMKNAVLQQRHNYWDTRVKAIHVFAMATVNGYELLGIRGGKIREGHVADLVLIDASELYPFRPDRLYSHLVYYASKEVVRGVVINGKIIDKKQLKEAKLRAVRKLEELLP